MNIRYFKNKGALYAISTVDGKEFGRRLENKTWMSCPMQDWLLAKIKGTEVGYEFVQRYLNSLPKDYVTKSFSFAK